MKKETITVKKLLSDVFSVSFIVSIALGWVFTLMGGYYFGVILGFMTAELLPQNFFGQLLVVLLIGSVFLLGFLRGRYPK